MVHQRADHRLRHRAVPGQKHPLARPDVADRRLRRRHALAIHVHPAHNVTSGRPRWAASIGLITRPWCVATPALEGVHAGGRGVEPVGGHGRDVRPRRVGQGMGRGPGHDRRHVRHAVVQDVLRHEGRRMMRGGPARLDAAALVDRDVHHHRARLHRPHHLARDHDRAPGPGHVDRADQDVGEGHGLPDVRRVRHHHHDVAADAQVGLDLLEPAQIHVEHVDAGPEAEERPGRRHAECARAQEHHFRGRHPGHARQQHPLAAMVALQQGPRHLGHHEARHVAERGQDRQRPVFVLDGLVRDRRHLLVQHRLDAVAAPGGQVQEAHQDRPFLQPFGFFRGGLGHFGDQPGPPVHLFAGVHDPGARSLVLHVGKPRVAPGVALHHARMTGRHEQLDGRGRQPDAMLVGPPLAWNSDVHGTS